jgi:CheY-like chemotaxis protein
MNLNILKAYCKKREYDFEPARDGQEAFEAYVKACEIELPPTICLLDLQMPVCDGNECAKMIRAYEQARGLVRCPIVMGECI